MLPLIELARLYDAGRISLETMDVLEYRIATAVIRAEADAKTEAKETADSVMAALGGDPNAAPMRMQRVRG